MLPPFFLSDGRARLAIRAHLAFWAPVGNNPVGTLMRLACGLAIALGLSFPATGMASRQQDAAGSAKDAAQAPATPAPQENAPAESAPAQKAPAETTPAAPANPPTPAAEKKASGTSSNGTRKRGKRTAPMPNGTPRKIVVREGGAREPAAQIAPGMTLAEATRQRQNAEQWLASADDHLKQLAGRTLDARQQETVGQIRNYMDGARSALKEGDLRRASTLAQKAHLLAADLMKH